MRGVLWLALALFLFACLDACFKYLVARYPVPVLAFARYLVHLSLMLAVLAARPRDYSLHTQRPGLVTVRAFCLVLLTLFMTFGLARLPLAEATSIMFVAPLLVAVLAGPVLGERVGALRWAAVAAGFVGVLLVVRPGGQLDALGAVLVFFAACSNAAYQMLSRLLAGTEKAFTMLFYSALAGTVCFGLATPFFLDMPTPDWFDILLVIGTGVTGGLGHLLFTMAYRDAPASLLAPVTYLQLLWAGILGWVVFAQLPDPVSLLGMAIIAVSGIVVAVQRRSG